MRSTLVLVLTLTVLGMLGVACGGSPAAAPPAGGSPAATPLAAIATPAAAAVPTKDAQVYPVVTVAPTVAPTAAPVQPTAKPAANPSAVAAVTGVPAPPPVPYPIVKDGPALMNERCTVCHDLVRIQSAKKSRADWESTVAKQKAKGAKLTDAETTVLVDFLAATYK